MVHIVGDPEGIGLHFKAGEDHSQVHHGLSQRRGGVDPVLYGDKFHTMLFQEGVKGAEIHHIRAHPIYFVDDYAINKPGRNIIPELIHAGAIHI